MGLSSEPRGFGVGVRAGRGGCQLGGRSIRKGKHHLRKREDIGTLFLKRERDGGGGGGAKKEREEDLPEGSASCSSSCW